MVRATDEYTRFTDIDLFLIVTEKGVFNGLMNFISMSSGLPEIGFVLLISIFFIALYLFINIISNNGADWDPLILALLVLSPILTSSNNFRQNIAILLAGIVFWLHHKGSLRISHSCALICLISLIFHYSCFILLVVLLVYLRPRLFPVILASGILAMCTASILMDLLPYSLQKFFYMLEYNGNILSTADEIFDVLLVGALWALAAKKNEFIYGAIIGLMFEMAFYEYSDFSSRLGVNFEIFETLLIFMFLKDGRNGKNFRIGKYVIGGLIVEQYFKLF